MAHDSISQAADILMGVRRGGPQVPDLGAAAPRTEAEVWAIQREVLRRLGGRIGGWKCAAPPGKPTSAAMLDAAGIRPAPATWTLGPGGRIGIETEIAFRLGRDLPPRATPYAEAEVMDAVEAAFPVVELVLSRFADTAKVTPLEAMADCIAHAGLVTGADVPDWRARDLKALTVRQSCGGAVQVEKVGGNPSGAPEVPLVWLANYLPAFGLHLQRGQVVTTGSCTGLIYVEGAGQRVAGEFPGFGAPVVIDLA